MNEINSPHRFALDAVRKFEGGADAAKSSGGLNAMARQVATQYRRDTTSPVMVSGVLRLLEFGMLFLTGLVLYAISFGFHLSWQYPAIILTGSLLTVVLIEFIDCYQISALLRPVQNSGRLLLVWSGTFAVLAVTGFFMKVSSDFSRMWFGSWFITGLVMLLLLRLVMSRMIRRWARNGRMERRAVIVGGGKAAEGLIRSVELQPDNDIRICGIFDDRDDKRSPPVVAGYPKLGNVTELIEFARIARIDMLIVSLPLTAETRVLSLLKKLWVLPVDIRLSAHSNQLRFRPRAYSYIGAVPMLDIFDKPINDWDSVAKRAFDIIFSIVGIIVFSPVMLATAIAVKLDSKGPVIFRQKRHGFNNEVVEVYKFRSMYVEHADPSAKASVTKNDSRVTRSAASSARPRSTSCRNSSIRCSARCHWSARGRMRWRRNPTTSCGPKWSTAISRAIASSRASPAGRRSMAGAARSTPTKRSRCAPSSTSTTSRTGRCCSTSRSSS